MPKTRFLTWYRLIPLAAVFVFGLISFVYSYAPASFTRMLLLLSLNRCIRLTTRRM